MAPEANPDWLSGLHYLAQLPLHAAGQRATDFLAVARLVPVESIFACEGGPDAVALSLALGVPLRSLEQAAPVRRRWSNDDIGRLNSLVPDNLTGRVALYAASHAWEDWAQVNEGAHLLSCPSILKDQLDDKAVTRALFVELGVETPDWALIPSKTLLRRVEPPFGWPLVLQGRHGSSGESSRITRNRRQVIAAVSELGEEELLVSRYIPGVILNLHGVVGPTCRTVSPPSVQIAGIRGLATSEADYCGNDFGTPIQSVAAASAAEAASTIADWLGRQGYRGAFGMDFVLDGDHPLALEINPRLQGSSFVLGEAELREQCFPTVLRHLLVLLGKEYPADPRAPERLRGAHLIFRQLNQPGTSHVPRPGAYMIDRNARVRFSGFRAGLLECAEDEVLVFGLPPTPAPAVEPGAVMMRLATWRAVATRKGTLNEWGRVLRRAYLTGRFAGTDPPGQIALT